jgi:hypothetical protein
MAQAEFPPGITTDIPPEGEILSEIVESAIASLRVVSPSVEWEEPEIL